MPPDTIYMWNLKYDTKELISQNRNRHRTDRTGLWLRRGMEGGGGLDGNLEFADANYYTQNG